MDVGALGVLLNGGDVAGRNQVRCGPGAVRQINLDSPRFEYVAQELREADDDTTDAAHSDQRWARLAEPLGVVAGYAERAADRQRAGLPIGPCPDGAPATDVITWPRGAGEGLRHTRSANSAHPRAGCLARGYADGVTATAVGKRNIAELPHDPDRIQLEYVLEASLGNHDYEDTLEKWHVTAHLGEDFDMDHIPPCDACLTKWQATEEADGYVDDEERCPHRLVVGDVELVKVRWGGSQNPYWAMQEESQNLSDLAETVFNEQRTDYSEQFQEHLDYGYAGDLLVLYKAELAPAWRGFGLGSMIVADALHRLSPGCGAVMVHPTPIDSSGMSKDQWTRARDRLRETWGRLGFVPYASTPYMIYSTEWAEGEDRRAAVRKEFRTFRDEWHVTQTAARVHARG
ncbi:hypothetical protein OG613_47680 (plasmid) [Streptomyces sp. NBC_00015]|uniref:hypothetical protein n=1 Tax=Streptomyces sp. NBC_00015 TaxID=2903611 RepID=UPI00324F5992